MKILFVFFSLQDLSQSSMYSDMVNIFHKNGHEVFPMAPIIDKSEKSFLSVENDIEVLRVNTLDVFSKNKFKKGFANILLSRQYEKSFRKFWKDKKIDLIIVATPSVMFAEFISKLKSSYDAGVYLLQKDIFPQNAVDLGLMKKSGVLYNFFKKNEIKLLRNADWIGCTSPGNRKYLLKHNSFLQDSQVKLLYNSSFLLEAKFDAKLVSKYHLKDKFTVVFGGNMGKPQQLENVLNLANNCSVYKNVQFLIIGNGTEVEQLKKEAENLKLENINFLDKVKREDYFNLLSICNVGLISLHQDFTVPNTPMKLNDYLNAGIPVLASIDRENDLGDLLVQNKMGKYAFADSPEDLFKEFNVLYNNLELCKEFGENGKKFCIDNLAMEKTYENILNHIKQ